MRPGRYRAIVATDRDRVLSSFLRRSFVVHRRKAVKRFTRFMTRPWPERSVYSPSLAGNGDSAADAASSLWMRW